MRNACARIGRSLGKETITVRQLLAHNAGLFAFDEPVDRDVVADLDRLALVLARQTPAWKPGMRQAYHAISLGFYEGELMWRIVRDVSGSSRGGRSGDLPQRNGVQAASFSAAGKSTGIFVTPCR